MYESEHMDDQGRCYCGSLECLGNVRAMLSEAQVKLFEARAGAEILQRELDAANNLAADNRAQLEQVQAARRSDLDRITKLEANWSRVKDELQQYVDQGDFDLDGDTMHQFLFDEFELTLIEEVEVRFIIEVSASVKRPKGEDVNEYDFNLDDVSISVADSDWDIEITDYSFTDVDEA